MYGRQKANRFAHIARGQLSHVYGCSAPPSHSFHPSVRLHHSAAPLPRRPDAMPLPHRGFSKIRLAVVVKTRSLPFSLNLAFLTISVIASHRLSAFLSSLLVFSSFSFSSLRSNIRSFPDLYPWFSPYNASAAPCSSG